MNETGIFGFLALFSKIWKIGEIYRADKTEERAEPCPTPMLTFKNKKEKLFYKYCVFLPTK